VSIEELGLGLSTVAALTVPPAGTVSVKDGAGGSFDGDVGTGDGDERTGPFFIAEGGGAFEDDLEIYKSEIHLDQNGSRKTHLCSGLETG
jgi:hypothetical protein